MATQGGVYSCIQRNFLKKQDQQYGDEKLQQRSQQQNKHLLLQAWCGREATDSPIWPPKVLDSWEETDDKTSQEREILPESQFLEVVIPNLSNERKANQVHNICTS